MACSPRLSSPLGQPRPGQEDRSCASRLGGRPLLWGRGGRQALHPPARQRPWPPARPCLTSGSDQGHNVLALGQGWLQRQRWGRQRELAGRRGGGREAERAGPVDRKWGNRWREEEGERGRGEAERGSQEREPEVGGWGSGDLAKVHGGRPGGSGVLSEGLIHLGDTEPHEVGVHLHEVLGRALHVVNAQ